MIVHLSCLGNQMTSENIIPETQDNNHLLWGNWLLLLGNQFLPNIKTLSPMQEILKILGPVKSNGGMTGTVKINV